MLTRMDRQPTFDAGAGIVCLLLPTCRASCIMGRIVDVNSVNACCGVPYVHEPYADPSFRRDVILLSPACVAGAEIPRLAKTDTATQLLVDGRPFVMLAGELHNSSASSLEYMEPIWDKLAAMKLNTVLATVSWELVEPQEGQFDFAVLDGLLEGARAHDLKLVLLWFGSWKNGVSSYIPTWVKKDLRAVPASPGRRTATTRTSCPRSTRRRARPMPGRSRP